MINKKHPALLGLGLFIASTTFIPSQVRGRCDQLTEEQLNDCFELVDLVYTEAAEIIESLFTISKYTLAKKLLLKEMKRWAQMVEGDADPRPLEEQEKWLNETFEPLADEIIERYRAKRGGQ